MELRLLVVVAMLALFAAAPALWRRRQRRVQAGPAVEPPVPASLLHGAGDRTWLLFTTPWCASCGPVEQRLRTSDPDARIVTIDATKQSDVARALAVRSAPTALLTGGDGRVRARLVGPEAVDRYLRVTR